MVQKPKSSAIIIRRPMLDKPSEPPRPAKSPAGGRTDQSAPITSKRVAKPSGKTTSEPAKRTSGKPAAAPTGRTTGKPGGKTGGKPPVRFSKQNKSGARSAPRRGRAAPGPSTAPPGMVRIQKVLADSGVASRRASEEMVTQGRVSINGETRTKLPIFITPDADRVEVDGRPIRKAVNVRHVYLLVNKPRMVLCTNGDELGRRTVIDLVPHTERLFCVGRLDSDATGLVLLTNDGDLANRLTHQRYSIAKIYEVSVKGALKDDDLDALARAIWMGPIKPGDEDRVRAATVKVMARESDRTRLLLTLREGRNREVRLLIAKLGFKVRRLNLLGLGPLRLKGVARGSWRALERNELSMLRQAARRAEADVKKGVIQSVENESSAGDDWDQD